MAIDRIVSLILRGAELVFAAIVAGVNGQYLHDSRGRGGNQWRFIYTEVVAALGIFFALIWLIPFSSTFTHWPIDLILSILFWISFGVLVNVSSNKASFFLSKKNPHVQCLQYSLAAYRRQMRQRLQLEQRPPHPRRPVRQVQGHHCLYLFVRHPIPRLCFGWHALDPEA